MKEDTENIEKSSGPVTRSKKKLSTNKIILLTVGIATLCALLICCTSLAIILVARGSENTTSEANEIPEDYETFTQEEFEIGYPKNWTVEESSNTGYRLNISTPISDDEDFSDILVDVVAVNITVNPKGEALDTLKIFGVNITKEDYKKLEQLLSSQKCQEFYDYQKNIIKELEESFNTDFPEPVVSKAQLNGMDVCLTEIPMDSSKIKRNSKLYEFIYNDKWIKVESNVIGENNSNVDDLETMLSTFNLL